MAVYDLFLEAFIKSFVLFLGLIRRQIQAGLLPGDISGIAQDRGLSLRLGPAQKNGEVGTLLRVIGQAGLSRLGNDALAGVADDVQPFRFLKVCHGP